jgi:hypothetical protein
MFDDKLLTAKLRAACTVLNELLLEAQENGLDTRVDVTYLTRFAASAKRTMLTITISRQL